VFRLGGAKHGLRYGGYVLPDRVKRGYGVKYTFRLIKRHIRVLPVRVKRGYDVKYTFRLFKRHIRRILGCVQLNRVRMCPMGLILK
jgi:hypothetical protein